MGIRDKHDPREQGFRHFVRLDTDGRVVAVIEVLDDGVTQPEDTREHVHVNVTDLHPYDFTDVQISSAIHPAPVKEHNLFSIRAELRAKNKARDGR